MLPEGYISNLNVISFLNPHQSKTPTILLWERKLWAFSFILGFSLDMNFYIMWHYCYIFSQQHLIFIVFQCLHYATTLFWIMMCFNARDGKFTFVCMMSWCCRLKRSHFILLSYRCKLVVIGCVMVQAVSNFLGWFQKFSGLRFVGCCRQLNICSTSRVDWPSGRNYASYKDNFPLPHRFETLPTEGQFAPARYFYFRCKFAPVANQPFWEKFHTSAKLWRIFAAMTHLTKWNFSLH